MSNISFLIDSYSLFLKCKKLPKYKIVGSVCHTDEVSYNHVFHDKKTESIKVKESFGNFDYQVHIVNTALKNKKYAIFADCGLGKTRMFLSWADAVGKTLILCPLSVMSDIIKESKKIFGYSISNLRNGDKWDKIALMNYEAMRDIDMDGVKGIVIDESSILKNGDGEIRKYLEKIGTNIEYKLCCSATPSPNDQSEYATHAVFLEQSNTLKEYYSRYFRKDGTNWVMKGHAVNSFYENLSTWACYIKSPSSIGFEQGAELKEEPDYQVLRMHCSQKYMPDGQLFGTNISLQESSKIFTKLRSDTSEERFIKSINAIKDKKTIVWCSRNDEETAYKNATGGIVINGKTKIADRVKIIEMFKSGEIKILISKPKVLGWGVNIQEAECHLFSGYTFSFEEFYQAVRRSHRYGRKGRLVVYIPVTEAESPIWDILNKKLKTFENDCDQIQKRFFK